MTTLQILHGTDFEGGVDAIADAPNFAAVVDEFERRANDAGIASVLISSGDNYIPGPFFNAGGDGALAPTYEGFYNDFFGLIDTTGLGAAQDANGDGFFDNGEIEQAITDGIVTFDQVYVTDVNGDGAPDYFEEIDLDPGRLDIAILNRLGLDASAVGNHEFDAGSGSFDDIINYESEEGNDLSPARFGNVNYLQEVDSPGAQFPYLAANLDFSADGLADIFTSDIETSEFFESDLLSARVDSDDPAATGDDGRDAKIAPATIIEEDDERIGVVGATTQVLSSITSSGGVTPINAGTDDMPALAAVLQPVIDDLTADGVDKIILTSHLQQFALEEELAGLLEEVDVIIAGGSGTILANDTDALRSGDTAAEAYPKVVDDANGEPTAIVSTAGEYSYVGRLVVEFDDAGLIIPGSLVTDGTGDFASDAFATDDAGVEAVTGVPAPDAIAASDNATDVQNLAAAVTDIVTEQDGDIAGETEVFLDGRRESVRTEETNLGNLTADANLAAARAMDPEVAVSIKNGGGIRAAIGEIVDLGDGTSALTPPAENPVSGKDAGEISALDISNSLRFDNGLVTVELTPEQLLIVLEHAVAATAPGATPGQFPQVGGLQFSFDPSGTAQELDDDGNVTTAGERVQNVWLLDDDGTAGRALVSGGAVVPAAPASIKVVTLDFLAGGGDDYPFPAFSAATDLGVGEQEALSTYLTANFPAGDELPFDDVETEPAADTRIQNLAVRADTVGEPAPGQPAASGDLGGTQVAIFAGEGGEDAAEVVAQEAGELFVTNGEQDRIDIFEIAGGVTATAARTIPLAGLEGYNGVQSVAVKNGVVAVAIDRAPLPETVFGQEVLLSQPGFVALFDAATGAQLSTVDVGNLPDQLTFTPDGTKLLVAGEGEKNDDSEQDDNPLGTVAIVDVADPTDPSVNLLDFTAFNGLEEIARAAGIRIQAGVSFAEDVEPEYITVAPDGTTAFVALQENNAIATVDLASQTITDVFGLGIVDFETASQLDPNDDGQVQIINVPGLVGLRMPDSIAAFETGGTTYVATANEGDSRDFDEERVGDLAADGLLDPDLVDALTAHGLLDDDPDTELGAERLEVSTIDGDNDGDDDIDVLHTFSSRSFSIFDADGNLVFDSGSEFEEIVAAIAPERFNDDEGDVDEDRSDAKGPEPEAIDVGEIDGRTYAFIGLERDSGVMIYDITAPSDAFFVNYIPPQFEDDVAPGELARQAPEIIEFIPAADSFTGEAQIAVAYEISGTTALFDLAPGDDGSEGPTIVLNEVLASHSGVDDTEFAELFGTPGASLDGLSLIAVEGDASGAGEIDERIDFGASDAIGDNGFYLVGNAFGLEADYGVSPDLDVDPNFENSSTTYALVETASLTGDSVSGGEVVIDAVAATDGDAGDTFVFDAPVIGPDGDFFPAGVRRVEDGVDTDSAADWEIADFFLGPDNTPTAGGSGDGDDGDDGEGPVPTVSIMEIQGAGHVSPFVLADAQSVVGFFADLPEDTFTIEGEAVATSGIVTAVDGNGFYLQDATGDGDIATADALFVFTGGAPSVEVGDAAEVTGTVGEFFPGDTGTRNLPLTQLVDPEVTVTSSDNALPAATVIGEGGRIPPSETIDDDAFTEFQPDEDGIDFFESLEAMLVTAQDTLAIAPTNRFGEIFTVVDQGDDATGLSERGTLNISSDDFNPEKVQIDPDGGLLPDFEVPEVNVGALLGDVAGVVSYSFGNFEILPTEPFSADDSDLAPETTGLAPADDQLTVASYNVLNLDPNDDDGDADVADGRFTAIAEQIVGDLAAPDIVALQEVQNNDGEVISDVATADETLQLLVEEIAAAGGPEYVFIDTPDVPVTTDDGELVRPVGGAPGGDIRNAFLYNPDRVDLVDSSISTILDSDDDPLPFFGGRIPLEATFAFNGEEVTLINNHFSSKSGSAPILGVEQPFDERQEDPTVNGSLDQRQDQAQAVAERVEDILGADPDAKVGVLGDLNEFEFISPVETILGGAGLTNLIEQLPEDERYTFIFQGNSQTLDHILASDGLIGEGAEIDIVHTNAEFAETDERASDHEPLLARFTIEDTPSSGTVLFAVNAGGAAVEGYELPDDALVDADFVDLGPLDFSADDARSAFLVEGGRRLNGTESVFTSNVPGGPAPEDDPVLLTERFDTIAADPDMLWQFPVAPGSEVVVDLYFAEIFAGTTAEGARVFDVNIEGGELELDDFDVYAAAEGQAERAVVKSFATTVSDDGILDVLFPEDPANGVENPKVAAIVVREGPTTDETPVAEAAPDIALSDDAFVA